MIFILTVSLSNIIYSEYLKKMIVMCIGKQKERASYANVLNRSNVKKRDVLL